MPAADPVALEAIKLLRWAAWPAVLVFSLLLFHAPLSRLIDRIGNIQFERSAGVIKARIETAVAAVEAERRRGFDPSASQIATATTRRVREGTKVLWLDDKPQGNAAERAFLADLGITLVTATSSDVALSLEQVDNFDLVISDFGRPGDPLQGFAFLRKLRARSNTPLIFYTSPKRAKDPTVLEDPALELASGITARPSVLFDLVLAVLS